MAAQVVRGSESLKRHDSCRRLQDRGTPPCRRSLGSQSNLEPRNRGGQRAWDLLLICVLNAKFITEWTAASATPAASRFVVPNDFCRLSMRVRIQKTTPSPRDEPVTRAPRAVPHFQSSSPRCYDEPLTLSCGDRRQFESVRESQHTIRSDWERPHRLCTMSARIENSRH